MQRLRLLYLKIIIIIKGYYDPKCSISYSINIYAYINKEIIRKLECYFTCICTCIFTLNEILHFTNDEPSISGTEKTIGHHVSK